MKCIKCGAELPDEAKFCSSCGMKIEKCYSNGQLSDGVESVDIKENVVANEGKEKLLSIWKRMDSLGKTVTVTLSVVIVLLLVSIIVGNGVATFFSVLQLLALVASVLMHKSIIKADKKWIKYFVLFAILLTVVNIKSYSWGAEKREKNKSDEYVSSISDIPQVTEEPEVTVAIIPCEAVECVGQKYGEIKKVFSAAGFSNIKTKKIESISVDEADMLNTVSAVSIAGKNDFLKGQEVDKETEILIEYYVYKKCAVDVHVDFVPNLIFNTYDVKLLLNNEENGTLLHGENQDFSFKLEPGEYRITFVSSESSIVKGEEVINVDSDMEVSYKISCHGDEVSVETLFVDKRVQLAESEVKLDTALSNYINQNYEDVTTALKTLGFTKIKYNVLYDIFFGFTANGAVESVSIAGNSNCNRGEIFAKDAEVIITYHMPEEDDPQKIKTQKSSWMFEGMNYLEAEQFFKDSGFTNITLEKFTTEDTKYTDGEVWAVEINGWSFDANEAFRPDAKVRIKYYSVVEPAPASPVFYSTNDYETACKGNEGVFSYRSKGGTYDIYWIIDLDKQYVYYFTEGNGSTDCDRVKIVSGTLNDKITITYHHAGDEWSYYLHFKYVEHPEALIMIDNDGFEHKYSTTDLSDALKLMKTKEIKDY